VLRLGQHRHRDRDVGQHAVHDLPLRKSQSVSMRCRKSVFMEIILRTKVSNSHLANIFYERLRVMPGCPMNISLAITSSDTYGWTALMSPAQRFNNPMFGKRFDALLTELRAKYDLASEQ
jgi:hypothetical protein